MISKVLLELYCYITCEGQAGTYPCIDLNHESVRAARQAIDACPDLRVQRERRTAEMQARNEDILRSYTIKS